MVLLSVHNLHVISFDNSKKSSVTKGVNLKRSTAQNTLISPNFLVWKFGGKAQFPLSFGGIARNYAETVLFHNISTPGNLVKLSYFTQWS